MGFRPCATWGVCVSDRPKQTSGVYRAPPKSLSRRKALLGGAAFGAAMIAGGPLRFNVARAAASRIAIGFPVPLTGPYALEAADQVRCAQLAVDQFNAQGGLKGVLAELLVRDDMLNAGAGAAVTRDLIRKAGARFIAGSVSATVQLSVASVAAAEGAVYVSISQSDAINEAPNAAPTVFHEALNPHMTARAVGDYVFRRYGPRVAYLVADYTYGHEMARGLQRVGAAHGVETVEEVRHPIATEDFSPFLPKLMAAKPDVLCLCNFGRDQLYAVRDAVALGMKAATRLVAPVLLYHQRMAGRADDFEGVLGGTNFHWTLEDQYPSAKAFNDAYRAAHGQPPSDYGAYGYSGVRSLLEAMLKADDADPAAVAQAMRGMVYDHYKGRQWFRPCDGQSVQAVFVAQSKAAAKMANAHDVFEILHVQEADEAHLRGCAELGLEQPSAGR